MEENQTPGHRLYQEPATTGSSESLDDSSLVSSYASLPQTNYQVDNMLEVHDQGVAQQRVSENTANVRHAVGAFSKRKALIVSVAITVAVTLFTGASALILGRNAPKANDKQSLATPVQDIDLENEQLGNLPPELQGADESLLVAGDIITRGDLKFSNNSFVTVLSSAELTGNQVFTLPNASGALCLDSNNCNYTNLDQFNLLNNRVNQLGQQLGQIDITAGVVTALNNQQGAITIQGTSNQISVTTSNGTVTLSTPQDLAAVSSPTFSNLLLTGNFTVNGIIDTGLDCTTFLNGGALTTNASGQLICADDEVSGGGTSVITAGGTIGAIPVFVAADEIADSIISQALGTITVSGDLDVTGAISGNSLTLTTALTVPNGGTGATSFVANSLLIGNGAGAVTSTNAAANGQVLLGNGTTPTFTTISGDIAFGGTGVTTIQADSVALGVDTTGNYVADIAVGNGLSVSGGAAEGATPTVSLSLQANKGLEVDVNGLSLIDCGLNQVLKYNGANQWACAADADTTGSFNVAGDSGTPENVANGDTVTIQGGNNITTTVSATDTVTIDTVNNPTFTTSVTTPLLQSSGALSITPGGALTVGAAGQTALLQGSTTTITSNGAGNDIVLTSADQIQLSGFNCTTFTNGGVLTTDASGNISCANDDSAPANTITGAGTANRLALFTGAQAIADSWLLQNGSTLELDNTRNLSLTGGNFSVTGTGLFTGLITANGGISVEVGDTFSFNGDAFTDLTGTGLQISSGSLQTTLGTSVDLTSEVTGILPVVNGGTGVDGSAAANGTLLIGNGTGYTLATLTAGSGITVNNGSGSIEIVNFFGTSIESGEITDLTITGADIANDTIALGTKTTGNYVATIGGNAQVSVSGSGSESAAVTLSLVADSIGDVQLAFDTGQHLTATSSPTFNGLTLSGNLTVDGGNTTIGTAAQAGTLTLSDGSANTGAIQTAGLGQNTTFTLPDPGGVAATICLSTGNCAGAGGGVTTAGGTANRIALFNGAQTIADSWLLQNGSTLQLDNTRNLELIGGNLTLTNGNLNVTGNQTTSGSVTFSALANGFLEVNGSGLVAVGTIDLGADTTGNYVATITNGNGITGSSASEGGTPTIALGPLTADWVQSGAFDIVLGDAGAELRILESAGATFYGTFDVGDLSGNESYTFLQGGTVVTSGNVSSFATTAVTAGNGLTGGGTTGALTLDIGAGNGITVNANDIAVIYGSAANTAVQGNTSITVSAGTNLTGGGSITLGAGGTVTLDVANSPTFSGTVTVQGSSVSIGTASTTTGSLDLYNAGSTFAGSVQVASLGQATLYTLPDPGAATASICLSTGNCAGAGGGVTTAGGTNNQLAKFTGAQVISDSTISDDGTNVTTSVDLIVQGGSATIGTALQDGALTIYGNGFTAAISASLTGNQAYTLPDGTGEFCIKELGNCSGAGGGNAPNSAQYLTLALDAGLTSERTLSFNGTNFSVVDGGANGSYTVNTAQNIDTTAAPSFAGLTLTGNLNLNANTIQGTTAVIDFTNFDVTSAGVVTAGTYNGQTISNAASFTGSLTVAGLTTLNGGLTIETGDTLTFNGDAFTDLTGNGLQVSTNVLTLMVQANKGLEVDGNGLSLIDCASGEVLKYNGSNQWACATDAGSGGLGDDVSVNGVAATGANFVNTAADGTTASITWSLNNVTDPDEISLTVGVASATEAGIITTGAQTFAGVKTFNNGITLAANQTINLTGGTTANRPGSPTEGMLYFDTDADMLLVYANGKWQADRTTATKIVAASNSQNKEKADYVADGTDDEVQINSALAALPAGGGVVYLLEGTYSIGGSILVPSNATLTGSGDASVIFVENNAAAFGIIENSDQVGGNTRITLSNFKIDGNLTNQTSFQHGIFMDTVGSGTGITSVPGIRIDNLTIENTKDTAIYLFDTKHSIITNTVVTNSDTSDFGGVWLRNTENITFSNNTVQGSDGAGVVLWNVLNTTITGNTIADNDGDGISGAAPQTGTVISNNILERNTCNAMYLEGTDGLVSGNSISNSGEAGCGFTGSGIVLNGASRYTLSANTIYSNDQNGIYLNSSNDNTVSGNKISNSSTGASTAHHGIRLSTSDRNNITGNNITDTAGTGHAISITNATSDNNYLSANSFSGTGATTINDAGTGTIYGGQLDGAGNFAINPSGTIELQSNSNVTGTLTVSGLITANGGLTVEAGDTFTMNGDAFTDLTGNGLAVVSNALTISVQANKGLEVDGNGLSLIDCVTDDYILKYDTGTGTWGCAADAGGAGVGDDVTVNAANADGANFIDTTATGSVAGVVFNLNNVPAPDNISITISNASATEAGAVTTGVQTFAGAKTFNGQIIAGAGIDLGSQTLQGTTSVINFTNFDVDASGNTTVGGTLGVTGAATLSSTLAVQGASITVGAAALQGTLAIHDGSGQTGSLSVANLAANRTYTLPEYTTGTGTICLDSGNCAGSGSGVTTAGGTTDRIAKFTGSQAIGDSSISDNGTVVSVLGTVDLTVQGGDVTLGTTSGAGSIILHDGNGQTTTITAGDSAGNLSFVFPTTVGSNGQCVKNSATPGVLTFANCNNGSGAGGSITLQDAYDAGNTIATTDNRNLAFTFSDTATDSSFVVNLQCTTCSASGGRFAVQNGGTDVFTVSPNSGGTLVKVAATAAFQVQNTSNNEVLTVNTTGNEVRLGKASTLGGKLVFNNASNANTVTIEPGTIANAYTLNLPNLAAGSYDLCTSSGNCAGAGGGITGSGTSGQVAYFNGTGTITSDADFTFDGANVTIGGNGGFGGTGTFGGNLTVGGTTQTFSGASGTITTQVTASVSTPTSPMTISTGGTIGATSNSGSLTLSTGLVTSSGNSGAITLQSGNTVSGAAGNILIDNGTGTSGTPTINLGATNARAITIGNGTGATAVTINAGTGGISIGNNAVAKTITIGSTTGASALLFQAGTGNIDIGTSANARAINIGTGAAAQVFTIGNTTNGTTFDLRTGGGAAINIGSNNLASTTVNIAGAAGTGSTVNIANGGFGSTSTVAIGSNMNVNNTVAIYAGSTGGITLSGGPVTVSSTLTVQGATVTVGAAALQGSYVINDGDAETVTITVDDVAANSTVRIPNAVGASDTFCLLTLNNCAGSAFTLQQSYNADADGSDAIIALTTADDSIIIRNPAVSGSDSAYPLTIDQLNTGAYGGLFINSLGTGFALRVDDSSGDTTPFVIDSNGAVGMGTSSPQSALHIVGNGDTLRLEGTDHSYLEFYPDGPGGREGYIGFGSNGTDDISFANESATGALLLFTNSLERFRIDASGNVAIGDASPDGRLDVELASTSTSGATERGFELRVTDTGVVTTGTDTTYGQQLTVTRTGATGGTINTYGLDIQATGDTGGTSTLTGLNVNVSGADTNYAAIFQGGRVGIGVAAPAYTLDVYSGSTATSGSNSGSRFTLEVVPASAPGVNTSFSAASSAALVTGANVNSDTTVTGYLGIVNSSSSGTLGAANGLYGQIFSSGNITNATGVVGRVFNTGTGTFASAYGIQAQSPVFLSSGAITNAYGMYIDTQEVAGVGTGYGLYQVGANDTNYFAGSVGIGTASPASGRALHVIGGDNVIRVQSTTGSAFIEFRNTGSGANGAAVSSTGDNFQIWTAGSARLTVSAGGDSSFSGNVSSSGAITADSTGTFGAAHATLGVQMGGSTNGSEIKLRNSGTSHFSIANTANTLTIGAANGNAGIGSAITPFLTMDGSTGATSLASTLAVQGASVTVGAAALQGSLILNDGNGGQTATIRLGNVAANTVLTMPSTLGATDTFCFVTLNNCVGSGVTAMGALDGQAKNANGATIASQTLYLQSADGSNPGLVTTGAQNFGGAKTFDSSVTVATNLTVDTNTLFVDATNNIIGMGTASPSFKLHIVSDGGTGAGYVSNDTYGGGSVFQGRSANGTLALPTALTTGNIIAQFSGRGYGATGFSGTRAAVVMNAAENWTDTAQGSNINFFTTALGTTTLAVQATLTGAGNFGLGTETPTAPFGGRVLEVQNASGNASLFLNSGASNAAMLILGDGTASWHIENDTNDFFSLTQSGVAQRFAIDTSGNVGIGVYDATYRLDVQTDSLSMRIKTTDADVPSATDYFNDIDANFEVGINGSAHAANPNDAYLWQFSNNDLRIGTNNTERLHVAADGNIFIGNGSVNAAPNAGFLQATGGSGTDIAGASLTVAGGRGTGTGVGGNIVFQYAPAGSTGASLNALQTACSISGTNGSFSCPGAGAGSQRFGLNSTAAGADSLAVGEGAASSGLRGVSIGRNTTSGQDAVSLGHSAAAGTSSVAVGSGASATGGDYSIAIGNGATTTGNNGIALGTSASAAASQLVVNNVTSGYFGNGVTNAAPSNFTLQGTGSSTAGTIGGVFTVAGGAGATATTGSAGGGLNLQGGNAGGSGNNNGGNVAINGGTSTGTTGLRGSVDIQAAGGNVNIGANNNGALVSWTTNGNALPATRADAGIVSHNGYVYVFGGSAGGVFDSPITTVHYAKVNTDGSIGTWGTTTAMNAARQEFGFTVANGYVYAFGGNSGSYLSPTATNTVQFARIKADGTLDTWQTTTNLPGTRRLTSAASANGYVYVVGGTGGQTAVYYGKVNVDGTISSWTTSANSLPAGREAAGVAAANGYLYVVGGADSGATAQTSVYYSKLDPTNGANAAFSTETDTLPTARADAELVVMNGHLYLLGGQAGSAVSTTYYAQMNNNGSINAWTTNSAPITAGRYGHMSVAVNGYAYVMGGINAGAGQSTVYYASIQRVRMAGAIDLLGISGENMAEGGIASSLAAGNTFISGSLQVTDTASIAGAVTIGRELSVGGSAYVRSASATDVGMTVQGASGQTADLMQLKDGTGAVVAKFLADGTALFGSAANCGIASTLICIDESRIELKNNGGNNSTQIIQNSNGPLEFSNGPNSGTTFAGVLVKGDKTTAFQIQNGSSQSIFTADTVNSQLLTSNISPLTAASVTTNKATLIASTNDVGWYSSVKIGKDGFARIVYYDVTDGDLEYVRCTNYDCTTSTTTTIDSTGDVGDEPKMEIGTDGFARIAYVDTTNTSLKYAVCNNDNCSAPTINTVDNSATDTGSGVYLALTSTNLARMTYYQYNSTGPVGALRYAECTVDACASGTANFTNIDATSAGLYTAIVLGADGLARIAYAENNNNDLAYVRCLNSGCTSTTTPVIIDATADNTGYVYGMVLDRQGNAMIPYTDNTGLDLEFIRCNNVDCTSRSSNTLDSTGNVGSWNSVVLGHDGFARIAYYDFTNKNLKYVVCQSLDCASNSISTLEGTGVPVDVGSDTAIDIRPDGRIVITHYDVGNGDLRMMQPSYSEGLSIGGASNRFARLFVADAEVTSTLRIGDTSNGINFSATNGFRLSGTARNSNIATLKPEYEGATFRGDGTTNIGTLNSGFCSNETGFAINTGACNTGEDHSYYEWTHNETTDQDYDIIVRYRIPDNFDSAEAFSNHAAIRGFSSKSAASTDNNVTLALYNDRGAQCGTTTNITNGTANQWGSGVLLSSVSGDGDCDDIDAGEYVTFVIHMTANSTGTTGEIIRMGEIEISYKSTY